MIHKLIYLPIIIAIIIYFYFYNTIFTEGMSSNISTIVLLGDSIFQNSNYVPKEKSIEYLLKEHIPIQSMVLAQDNATINLLYQQYKSMPSSMNNKHTNLYISIGGNDLLNAYDSNDINDTNLFDMIWNIYKSTILNLSTITQCNIILTDIYYITDSNYAKYIPIIKKWNATLYQFANKHQFNVFKISKILTKAQDFTNGIEPSIIGGTKMVNSFNY
jgi:hypothetical protein